MKKIYTFFMVTIIAVTLNAQLVMNENFTGYTTGNLGTQGFWVNDIGTDVQVANTTPLVYPTYTSGTEYVTISSTNGTDPYKPFSTNIVTTFNRTIFISFVVRVTAAPEFNQSPAYTVSLRNTSNANIPCRFYIAERNGALTDLAFGISVGNASPVYTALDYEYNTTYLIVIRYDIITGANNDQAYLWVNPSLASEPATGSAQASQTGTGEVAYGSPLNALQLTQSAVTSTPASAYDAFRVSHGATSLDAWTNLTPAGAPLPVKLNSFSASKDGDNVKLVWHSSEEVNFKAYIIERSADGRNFTAIGSVEAAGKTSYSFTDIQPASDYNYYRLRMTDLDGAYKLSHVVSIKSKATFNVILSPNPVKDRLLVQHPLVAVEGRLQVLNVDGRLVKDLRLPAGSVMTTVDLSGLSNGIYHVIYKSGKDIFSKKVLKQ